MSYVSDLIEESKERQGKQRKPRKNKELQLELFLERGEPPQKTISKHLFLIKSNDIEPEKGYQNSGSDFVAEKKHACGNTLAAKSLTIQHVLKMLII